MLSQLEPMRGGPQLSVPDDKAGHRRTIQYTLYTNIHCGPLQ